MPAHAASVAQRAADAKPRTVPCIGLEDGPQMYQTFREKEDGCIKLVLKP
jgi:threonine dehydrogenase-like Zn-dependent dehydrogenase